MGAVLMLMSPVRLHPTVARCFPYKSVPTPCQPHSCPVYCLVNSSSSSSTNKLKMPEVHAEEIKDSAPVASNADQCAEIIKAKETCLSEGGDCTELMKSFEACIKSQA